MRKVLSVIATIGLLSFVGCGGGDGDTAGSGNAGHPIVTRAEYDQIQNGMTYDQVVAIVGSAGSETLNAGGGTFAYTWLNPDTSGAEVIFMNGAVYGKDTYVSLPYVDLR
ncbi:MAG: hypothetical protein WCN95_08605 [bacterium]